MKFVLALIALASAANANLYYSGLPYTAPATTYYQPSFIRSTPVLATGPRVLAANARYTTPWGYMMNNYVWPIRSSGKLLFAKLDGTTEELTFESNGINFSSNNIKMQRLLDAIKDVFMDPAGFKGLPMESEAEMVFVGFDGQEKSLTFGNKGFNFFSNNAAMDKIFAEFTAAYMNRFAAVSEAAATGSLELY